MKKEVSIFWFRRDLRFEDNAGLYHALKGDYPVLPLFIFDREILDKLEDKDDARLSFIVNALNDINTELHKKGSSILAKYNTPDKAWKEILSEFDVKAVYTNTDYESYAKERDAHIEKLLAKADVKLHSYKDQVIFEKDEIVKDDGKPYTVFSPYRRKWFEKLKPDFHFKPYPTEKYAKNLYQHKSFTLPSLESMGFTESKLKFPDKEYKSIIKNYANKRNFPAVEGTSRMSVHLRFGTVSIRQLAADGYAVKEHKWLIELIWRDFYAMILYHFPHTENKAFKPDYDKIKFLNDEALFKAWCEGKTGYPIVDAGMRQLNTIGWMHNRIRMVVGSFLSKHLLIDWRWGERYFARKLIDYDMASNVGGWQWAAGSGNDAAPYFRVFNPDLQQQKFDPKLEYIKKWVPEFDDPFKYPKPVVEHKFARERALAAYKKALKE